MKENSLSLKDINEMASARGKRNKKLRIEKLNLAASLKIKAHENLTKDNTRDELLNLKDTIRQQLKSNEVPLDAYTELLDGRIATMQERIDKLEDKKEDNGGNLRPGEENALKDYTASRDKYNTEKESLIKDFSTREEKATADAKIAQQVKADKEQREKEEADAFKAAAHEATVGRSVIEDRAKQKVINDELARKAERIKRGLDPKPGENVNG